MKLNIEHLTGNCSGCAACSVICPKKAIKIALDEEGFYRPFINQNKCVNCGICMDVCMKNQIRDVQDIKAGKVYAAQSKDSTIVKTCSSGGIASEMSQYAIENQYFVVGVTYDFPTNSAKTIIIDKLKDIELLKGSKYLQSYTEDAYKDVIQIAKRDPKRKFLAFGTPCQIYGLATVLEKLELRDRFILVDLFCHGIPSMLVWKNYLKKIEANNKDITSVIFRDKSIGWHNFVMAIKGKDFEYKKASEADLFYHTFFDNVLFAKSCFDCKLRKEKTKADIRLGDFWGKRYQEREDGISAVLICTLKGEHYFAELKNVQVIEETSVEEVLISQSIDTYKTSNLREKAFDELINTNDLEQTIKRYRKNFSIKKRMKLVLKKTTSYLPDGVRAFLRKTYKKRR